MIDRFEELLAELGVQLDLPLKSDRNHFCTLQIGPNLLIQLQTDAAFEKLLIISKVAEIPPGKFRENILKEALKANGKKDPRVGVFAYLTQINQLVLFQRYPFDLLNGERLAELLGPFIETAENWKKAIASGRSAPT
ncbi:MAG TPA: CesT family type III secretion system chaperone [Chlamydiales bacterium]|jgi:hypothetical protein